MQETPQERTGRLLLEHSTYGASITKYISEETIKDWQESIAFLDNYKPAENEEHIVSNSLDIQKSNKQKSLLLKELGLLNQRREYIIQQLLK